MGTKNNPGQYDCYSKADPDEPIFVLRGSDPVASGLVRDWVQRRLSMIVHNPKLSGNILTPMYQDKLSEALKVAKDMEDYHINLLMSGGKAKKPQSPAELRDELVRQGGYRSGREVIRLNPGMCPKVVEEGVLCALREGHDGECSVA